jgi:hypothetical protein
MQNILDLTIQSVYNAFYNPNNHFKLPRTNSNLSIQNDPRSSLDGTRHAYTDENWLCPSVLGDV